jgi:hypothetical protein
MCHYAECHYAVCHYAECRYAECHSAECCGSIRQTWEKRSKEEKRMLKKSQAHKIFLAQTNFSKLECSPLQKNVSEPKAYPTETE